jgi:hypothetical protein
VNPPICIGGSGGVRVAPTAAPEDCWMHFSIVVERVRSDFTEMPCLELTLAQAIRLWHVGADDCRFVLDALVEEGFLRWTAQRTIVRADHDSYINDPDSSLSHIPVRRMHGSHRRA